MTKLTCYLDGKYCGDINFTSHVTSTAELGVVELDLKSEAPMCKDYIRAALGAGRLPNGKRVLLNGNNMGIWSINQLRIVSEGLPSNLELRYTSTANVVETDDPFIINTGQPGRINH